MIQMAYLAIKITRTYPFLNSYFTTVPMDSLGEEFTGKHQSLIARYISKELPLEEEFGILTTHCGGKVEQSTFQCLSFSQLGQGSGVRQGIVSINPSC